MTNDPHTIVIRQIHQDVDGHFLEVGRHEDHEECVHLRATEGENTDYFGPLDIPMEPSFAMALGKALIAAAKETGAVDD